MLKVGMIGYGGIGHAHFPAWKEIEYVGGKVKKITGDVKNLRPKKVNCINCCCDKL